MEPIKIQIELKAGETLVRALENFGASVAAAAILVNGRTDDFKNSIREAVNETREDKKEAGMPEFTPEQVKAAEEEAKAKLSAEPEVKELVKDLDLEPVKEITDQELLAVVAEYKTKVAPKAIKAIFVDMGIRCSTECPKERRQELVTRIKSLAQ